MKNFISKFFLNFPFVFIKYIKSFSIPGFAAVCLLFLFCPKTQGAVNTWDEFINAYNSSGLFIDITLGGNLSAGTAAMTDREKKRLTIDGAGYSLDFMGLRTFRFYLEDSTITFKSIAFQRSTTTRNGGVIRGVRSSIAFTGNINFENNYAKDNGGAISGEDFSNISFANSTITFRGNRADYEQT
ncbi:MAG: hypothetical protein LBC07_03205, partial [Elusimicrobiota bacterium]|nr:hypothetical protein [Elusimicrobiota bacterium]